MELTPTQTNAVERQTNLIAITEEHAAFDKLQDLFGPHTFFANEQGLFVFSEAGKAAGGARMRVCAVWSEDKEDTLVKLESPADANLILDLESSELFEADSAPLRPN